VELEVLAARIFKNDIFNMKFYTRIGIISSMFLVLNYTILNPTVLSYCLPDVKLEQLNSLALLTYSIPFLGFYFSLYRILKNRASKSISEPIKIVAIIASFGVLKGFIKLCGINVSSNFDVLLNFLILIVNTIWTIRIVRKLEIEGNEELLLKRFAIALFIGYITVFIATIISAVLKEYIIKLEYNPLDLMNLSLIFYGAAYVFGLVLFYRINKQSPAKTI